ncbi:MAG: hypothetical protein PVH19_07855 [Planctomycetia bacterium]
MANRQWLEAVQRQLADSKLPSAYIQRFMEELSDHLEDLKEETMRNENDCAEQLGDPAQVADAAVVAYRKRTFFGRHPIAKFLAFGVSPLPAMLLTLILNAIFLGLLSQFLEYINVDMYLTRFFQKLDPNALKWMAAIFTLVLPTMLLAILYCRWARRSKVNKKWMLISCGIFSFLSLHLVYLVKISEVAGESQLCIGAGFGTQILLHLSFLQLTQMLGPLAVGLWYALRTKKKQPPTDETKEPLQAAA